MYYLKMIPMKNLWTPLYAALMIPPTRSLLQSASIRIAPKPSFHYFPSPYSPFGRTGNFLVRNLSSDSNLESFTSFKPGSKVQVEIMSFGPLGASVEIIALSHDSKDMLPEEEEPYATGIIYQKEIAYFRSARDNVDVVLGEILPAYVQKVRDDGKLDVELRSFGGKQKSLEVSELIIDYLECSEDGVLNVGDKSSPEDINTEFPGVSKTAFKKAVGALYKKGLIKPSPTSITLVDSN